MTIRFVSSLATIADWGNRFGRIVWTWCCHHSL